MSHVSAKFTRAVPFPVLPKLSIHRSSKGDDFNAFSKVFPIRSSDLSPGELTHSELRTNGLTPQRKSTGFSARDRALHSKQRQTSERNSGLEGSCSEGLCSRGKILRPEYKKDQLTIGPRHRSRRLSLPAGQAQGMDAHSKRVTFQRCNSKTTTLCLSHFLQKRMSRALFANTQGPEQAKRVNDSTTVEAAVLLTSQDWCFWLQKKEARHTSENVALGGRQKRFSIWQSSVQQEELSSRVNWSKNGPSKVVTNRGPSGSLPTSTLQHLK